MTMPQSTLPVLERQLLVQFGDRLKARRKSGNVTAVEMARRLGISRPTLRAMENGDSSVALGTYVQYMAQLGIVSDLAFLAGDAIEAAPQGTAGHGSAVDRPVVQISVTASKTQHKIQDIQSLVLHQAAIERIKGEPGLLERAIQGIDEQIAQAVETHSNRSLPLLKRWRNILAHQDWRKVLASTQSGNQLRQVSPITVLLEPQVRQRLLDEVRELKRGVQFETRNPP